MHGYIVLISIIVMICCVVIRIGQLKKLGIKALLFGQIDKKDFMIPPCALLFLYMILANVFDLPRFSHVFTEADNANLIGTILCILAPVLFIWAMYSFGKSFRIGIDENKPGDLVSTGAFRISRNPLYLAFFMIFLGVFLVFPSWIFFIYLVAGVWLVDRQVCLEENSLRKTYGKEYDDYCDKVRRYI